MSPLQKILLAIVVILFFVWVFLASVKAQYQDPACMRYINLGHTGRQLTTLCFKDLWDTPCNLVYHKQFLDCIEKHQLLQPFAYEPLVMIHTDDEWSQPNIILFEQDARDCALISTWHSSIDNGPKE